MGSREFLYFLFVSGIIPISANNNYTLTRIPEEGKEGAWRYAAEDRAGNRIELRDRKGEGWEPCTAVLDVISDSSLLQNQVLFGFLYYDEDDRSVCLHPRSIVTEKEIVRLLY